MSVLSVTVIGGRNFQKQIKSNEFTDKYCTVKIGDTTQKTVPKYSHQRNVTWGDFLEFNISKLPSTEEIVVTAHVKWTLTSDFIGEVRLPLADHREVPRRYAHEHWYPFGTGNARLADKPLDNSVGEIGLIIGMYDPSTDEGIHKRQIKDVDDPFYDKVGADEIYMEANEVAKDNKEIVQRMIRVAEQATEKGAETLNVLQVHSEQLEQAEDDVEIIHNQITHGDRKLRGIESCFCCCFTGCCGNDDALKQQLKKQNERAQAADKLRAKEKKDKVEERKELDIARQKNKNREAKGGANAVPGGAPIEPIKEENTQEKEFAEHVQEINEGLDILQNHIGNLKEMALKMGEEIDYENERIDNITSNTDQENVRLNKVVQRTKKQI